MLVKEPVSNFVSLAVTTVFLLGCSSATTGEPGKGSPAAPDATLFIIDNRFEWSTDEAIPDSLTSDLPILLPTSDPDGVRAAVEVIMATAGAQPVTTITTRWDNGTVIASLQVGLSSGSVLACDERTDGNWTETSERVSAVACEMVNDAGLYFLRWTEGGNSYNYETWLPPDEAKRYLTTWRAL